jgi:ABC-type lipoprotein export system ATPase subunit
MKITIKKIVRNNIFDDTFKDMKTNNVFDFTRNNISIIYGPNGTGKTSLAIVLSKKEDVASYTFIIDGKEYTESDDKFVHIIEDQNGRNIIAGEMEDFILGDNIKREYELKDRMENGFEQLYSNIITELKSKFGISTKESPFHDFIENVSIKSYVSDLANTKAKGKNIKRNDFLETLGNLEELVVLEYKEEVFNYFVNDIKSKTSVLKEISKIQLESIAPESSFVKIEQTDDAVKILEKYKDSNECIVCDNNFDREKQLEKKKLQNQDAIASLSKPAQHIIENILKKIAGNDPLNLKEELRKSLITGDSSDLLRIQAIIKEYESFYSKLLINFFISSVKKSDLVSIYSEYKTIIQEKPEFEDEDILFIENFLNDCLPRKIQLQRDVNNNLKLLLGDKEFLNQERTKLQLSNGEQNFLLLAFELLKAKKINMNIVVLDDPISSFDSIYKNKLSYAIVKFLESKKVIILTHTTDLIKLLEHQRKNCFNLYYMNNTTGEENGFIYVNQEEVKLLIYIHELLSLLRNEVRTEILDEKSYLISLVPFMRGYCQLTDKVCLKDKLTKIMHGYETESIDLSEIYNTLFANDADKIIKNQHIVSAVDIANNNIEGLKILKNNKFPLLSKTLYHTYTYLYLRLNVEKKLVEHYNIDTKKYDMLSNIIQAAFPETDKSSIQNRVFYLSRKTLLNEFNHFEMDMNIFQPAIDITNRALKKEKDDILAKLAPL